MKQAEASVADLNKDSTVDDAKSAVAGLESAVTAAKSAANEVGQAEADSLQTAYDDLKSSIDSISGSDTLAEAAPDVISPCHVPGTARRDYVEELWRRRLHSRGPDHLTQLG